MLEAMRRRRGARRARRAQASANTLALLYPKGFWHFLAGPGVLWLLLLFVVPFYSILATATGRLDPIFGNPIPQWNPVGWNFTSFGYVFENLFSRGALFQVVFVRTLRYVFSTVALCLLIGYPVAYYLSRLTGRLRNSMLILLVLPFWVSYLMRMLAWVNLLQQDGYVNRLLMWTGILQQPVQWLEGRSSTVIFGLAYGYVPFLILPLFAALDRIDKSYLEAARDLGASPFRTFLRITLPLSKQGILAGIAIIMLPMFGDYFTADLLSGRPTTSMIGSQIVFYMTGTPLGSAQSRGAALVVVLSVMVSLLTLYYIVNTAKASREARQQ